MSGEDHIEGVDNELLNDIGDMLDKAHGEPDPDDEALSDLDENDPADAPDEGDDYEDEVEDQDEELDASDEDESDEQDDGTDDESDLAAELRALREELAELKQGRQEKEPVSEKKEAPSVGAFDLSGEQIEKLRKEHGPIVDALILPMAKQLNAAAEAINGFQNAQTEAQKAQQVAQDQQNYTWAQSELDKLAEQFPKLGNSKKLSYDPDGLPNMKDKGHQVRADIFNRADALYRTGVCNTFQEAFDDAIGWYKGKHGEKEVTRKVVKDLNSRKKKISGRPTSKKTKKAKLTGDAAKLAIMEEAYKEAGLE